jgi:hypothetical protein
LRRSRCRFAGNGETARLVIFEQVPIVIVGLCRRLCGARARSEASTQSHFTLTMRQSRRGNEMRPQITHGRNAAGNSGAGNSACKLHKGHTPLRHESTHTRMTTHMLGNPLPNHIPMQQHQSAHTPRSATALSSRLI